MRAAPCRRAGNAKCLVVGKNETKGKPLAEDQEQVFVIRRSIHLRWRQFDRLDSNKVVMVAFATYRMRRCLAC